MPNKCSTSLRRIQALLDNEIARDSADAAALHTHLAACPSCRRLAEELRETKALLPNWQPPALSTEASARFAAALAERGARRSWWALPNPRVAWVLGCLLLLAVVGGATYRTGYLIPHQQVEVSLRAAPTASVPPPMEMPHGMNKAKKAAPPRSLAMPDTRMATTARMNARALPPHDAAPLAVADLTETGAVDAPPVADNGCFLMPAASEPPEATVIALLTETN